MILALLALAAAATKRGVRLGLIGVAAVAAAPAAAVALGALLAARRLWHVRRLRRRRQTAAEAEVVALGDLVLLGLTAGHGFVAALAAAASSLDTDLADEVAGVVRAARYHGAAAVLEQADGRAGRLYRLAGRAVRTGAPLIAAVEAFVAERREADHTAEVERARKLPVKLLFPLTLLVLPGFLLLLVAPTLAGALDRLGL